MYAARSRTIVFKRVISARAASSFACVSAISVASAVSRCWLWSTWVVSWVSSAWFWLTCLASAAKASGSVFGVPAVVLEAGGAVVVVVDGVVVVVVVVVVDVSWAEATAAGTNDAVISAPTITKRLRCMSLYRRERPRC